jgi:hypothetical protein
MIQRPSPLKYTHKMVKVLFFDGEIRQQHFYGYLEGLGMKTHGDDSFILLQSPQTRCLKAPCYRVFFCSKQTPKAV